MRKQKTKELVEIALFSAVLCVIAPFTIPVPVSPVPLSISTFVIYLAAVLLGAKQSALCVLVYLLLGMVGLPVFSGFSGGIGVLLGPTGGYLMGYIPCALIVGWLVETQCFGKLFGSGKRFAKNAQKSSPSSRQTTSASRWSSLPGVPAPCGTRAACAMPCTGINMAEAGTISVAFPR